MMAKIVQGRGFQGVINYVLDKSKAEVLWADGLRLSDRNSVVRSFITQSSLNPISKPVVHISLDFSAQDRDKLTNQKMVEIADEYLQKMGYGNTQVLIVRHNDTDHPHLHMVLNRIDNDGKRISDRNERIRSTKVCKELTVKHGLYFAKGKENVKEHRLREPDKTKYEIYNALKSTLPACKNWQELVGSLKQQGITVEFKTKGSTDKVEGIKFNKNGYSFSGSKVDKQFSFSKIDFALRQNSRAEQQSVAPAHSRQPIQSALNHLSSEQIGNITGGLLDGLLDTNPGIDPEEEAFRRQMQRKKRKSKGRSI